jgi:hypothetical protein
MDNEAVVGSEWRHVLGLLPVDVDETAFARLAIRRRREIGSGSDLLRLVLGYSLCDMSLRQTAAWAKVVGFANLSDVAVLKRLRQASEWVGHLVVRCLEHRGLAPGAPRVAVRIVDATTVSEPGSKGTDWRVHVGLDLASERITSVELTGPEGGETLTRHEVNAGEVVLADRGYAQRAGIASVLRCDAHVVARIGWQNFPLETAAGASFDVFALLETLGPAEIGDWPVRFSHDGRVFPVRLIAMRKSLAATEWEQRRARHEAKKRGRRADARTLHAAGFLFIITDMPHHALPATEALELYRLRWQIEIAFKRLKSLLHLDHLRAQDPALARCYLYAKLLAAILIDDLCERAPSFFPWGFSLLPSPPQPLALTAALD